MKDKRTYINKKEHGEDISHENESKIDTSPIEALTQQYKADLWQYKERESLYVKTKNQLDGTKQIVIQMSNTIRELKTQNDNLQAEIARLNEEIQLLEMKIKK
jgi:peptidoglycan hydrolase CwlO-like protein|tara:strand:+ start:240 stop:548 length:309 start_codon:yes stop_codon:yes gene_type:complete